MKPIVPNGVLTEKAKKKLNSDLKKAGFDGNESFDSMCSALSTLELFFDSLGLFPLTPSGQAKLPSQFLVQIRTSGSKAISLAEKLHISWTKKGSNFYVKMEIQ